MKHFKVFILDGGNPFTQPAQTVMAENKDEVKKRYVNQEILVVDWKREA